MVKNVATKLVYMFKNVCKFSVFVLFMKFVVYLCVFLFVYFKIYKGNLRKDFAEVIMNFKYDYLWL